VTEALQQITLESSAFAARVPGPVIVEGTTDYAYPVSIDGRGFLVDIQTVVGFYHSMQRTSVNLLNTQQAQSSGDLAQVPPEVWRRTAETWESGAGQSRFDRENGNPARFGSSLNVDVWTPWRLSLLPETDNIQDLAAGRSFLTTVGTVYLFAAVGTQGYWFTSLDSPPTSHTFTHAVVSVTTDGQNLYVLDDTGVVTRWTSPSTSTTFATLSHYVAGRTLIRYVNGFIVAAEGNSIYDISTGSEVLVYTHPLTDYTYVDACEGLTGAYLVGGMGDRWAVLRLPLKSDGTTFDPPIMAAPLPDGEIGYAVASYLGYVLVGVNAGWRFSAPSSDGSVTFGRLVETGGPVRCFEGQDRFVWFGLSAGTLGPVIVDQSGLGRADLSVFTAPLTPAYASDLTSAGTGVVRCAVTFGASATSKGWRVFTIDGMGVFAEQDTLAKSGWVEQGAMTFGTTDTKMGLYGMAYHEALNGSVTVEARYDDETGWAPLGSNAVHGSVSMGNMQINRSFNSIDLRATLTRDDLDNTLGPALTRMEVRALPVPGRATQWTIPVMLFETENLDTSTQSRDVAEDYDLLVGLVETRREFVYREGTRTWNLHATDFVWMPRKQTQSGDTYQGTFILTAREVL
jgi:hypothetical protein